MTNPSKRILVLVGTGASVDFGIPQTKDFTAALERELQDDQYCLKSGGWEAYQWVKKALEKYYGDEPWKAHFERVYHSLHELAAMKLIDGAVPKYKPVLYPFLKPEHALEDRALRAAAHAMLKAIYKIASTSSALSKHSLKPLTAFIKGLMENAVPRIYTTNYDDFSHRRTRDYSLGSPTKEMATIFSAPKTIGQSGMCQGFSIFTVRSTLGSPLAERQILT